MSEVPLQSCAPHSPLNRSVSFPEHSSTTIHCLLVQGVRKEKRPFLAPSCPRVLQNASVAFKGTLLVGKRYPLASYGSPMPWKLWWS